jgi:glycosyltransferase involved in cell wall biosynthesis
MKKGWLINDRLTCIPGTRTFWHDLLETIPELCDYTGGYTSFEVLADVIKEKAKIEGAPDYIIRNGTYFPPIDLPGVKTIVLIQDLASDDKLHSMQQDVCDKANIVIFNSLYTKENSKLNVKNYQIIPLGIDFNLFKPIEDKQFLWDKWGIIPGSILFVGANLWVKGYGVFIDDVLAKSFYNFVLIMKDDTKKEHHRAKVFNRLSNADVVEVMNACSMLVCTSNRETQHLASIEAGACGLPIVVPPVGVYYGMEGDAPFGYVVNDAKYLKAIDFVKRPGHNYSPRQYFLDKGYSKNDTLNAWRKLVENL